MIEAVSFDGGVRAAIARAIREDGLIPTIERVAVMLGADREIVDASFVRMIDGHVFIPRSDSHEIYAYNPFCVGPTQFRVRCGGRDWWGICGWDALGIPLALGTAGTIESACADGCGDRIDIQVGTDGSATSERPPVLHVGVPAREFWKDIRFT